ncbi:Uncharacterised protein [Vibrio cholerae]|uniref:Uncharacterized protein n=1 Tax=Vibrio cholerae TaxID=666 RepID=A0A655XH55_VIBCL|nr:Uncharacterised protein [Vibrio cholerae]
MLEIREIKADKYGTKQSAAHLNNIGDGIDGLEFRKILIVNRMVSLE